MERRRDSRAYGYCLGRQSGGARAAQGAEVMDLNRSPQPGRTIRRPAHHNGG
jgi:hypothetical protein